MPVLPHSGGTGNVFCEFWASLSRTRHTTVEMVICSRVGSHSFNKK